ncbi:hypothetical protein [Chitinophaga sp. S165]|uniref:hypothetical protein n=1 Tax=Chitinophaga sp. S165 TaxID=2135462 RepID=UPI000D71D025|nr:hypothetical protein [Chitinophaga sp. S165]PWV48200.1 hypothetical protein C7475_107106 [Chitinophaga sp. S165]
MDNKEKESYRKKIIISEMLLAFLLFNERGIEAVEETYPRQKEFVLENKHKSITEVKHQLLHLPHI